MAESTTGSKKIEPKIVNKYCIIHGHFYQPPRENPWLQIIEPQPSALPYHDWNERIFDECYRPNGFSRILDSRGMIKDIFNNYASMSFNFGPTLFLWLEQNHPRVTKRIIEADQQSCVKLENHGNGLAQVYNHLIMPLANRRDQRTQIRWGKSFFYSRFGRQPEGMWLAETAINMETVRCLIEEGIKFVVLSPTQADKFRPLNGHQWVAPGEHGIDTRRPYRVYAYSDSASRQDGYVDVFFFNEGLSRSVSFESLLGSAEGFAEAIRLSFSKEMVEDQAVIIATDGETFGHHKPFGDMCLSYFFAQTAKQSDIQVVNFGYLLAKNPPAFEVVLKNRFGEGCAWSCAHGTGRWIRDCGCQTGGDPSWNQKWRTPLRQALDGLQVEVDKVYEESLDGTGLDPWYVRDMYEPFHKNTTCEQIAAFLKLHGLSQSLAPETLHRIQRLLEAQKYMLFAYTSCGWFFSDISGIETIQNLQYACRALQLAIEQGLQSETGQKFLATLETAQSNIGFQNGKTLFLQKVSPYSQHLALLCYTAAITNTLFERSVDETVSLFGYVITLRHIFSKKQKEETLDFIVASIRGGLICEQTEYSLQLNLRESAPISALVVPFDVTKMFNFNVWEPQAWKRHPDVVSFSFQHLFLETKAMLSNFYVEQVTNMIIQESTEKFESYLEALLLLDGTSSLTPMLRHLLTLIFTGKWNLILKTIESGPFEEKQIIELRQIWQQSQRYNITIDLTRTIEVIQKLLQAEMESFSQTLSLESCHRMRYLLNIVDRFSIPLRKSSLEDWFFFIFHTSIQTMYKSIIETENPTFEQKSLLLQLLSFARRMNFNTEGYSIQFLTRMMHDEK
ncbi:MAG: DUF3536 domain-containing protein [Chitinivibrionales bacterium]|nr:DUF3536 domain-containing protein [Chitinivibrionales bacterium]